MLQPVIPELVRREVNGAEIDGASFSPLLHRVLSARGIGSVDEIDFSLNRLISHECMPGIEAAVNVLEQAFLNDSNIVIVGDYDADGATSTALLMRAFRAFGFTSIDYAVPDRFRFGYGLTPEIVEFVVENKQPDLIITVDNGIASVEGVEIAKDHGVEVIVTDHHLPGKELPAAAAIVNPNLESSSFPSRALAGVGVAFYLAAAMRRRLISNGHFEHGTIPNLANLLDLVAVGTVADVVPLDDNNRILVEQGLRRIRNGKCNPGIRALMSIARRPLRKASTVDLGFAVAPRLNAAGRLEDISAGIECLLAKKPGEATKFAGRLDSKNNQRRKIEKDMQRQALLLLEEVLAGETDMPVAICLLGDDWHEGVIGLLASQLKERFYRPAAIFTRAENGEIKGSLRSIPGIHVRDLLERISLSAPGLIDRFGGHAMAAGVTLADSEDGFERFKTLFVKEVTEIADTDTLACRLLSDGALEPEDFSFANAVALRTAAPWGVSFPEPLFDGLFEVDESRVVGKRHLQLELRPDGTETKVRAILYNMQKYRLDENEDMHKIRIAYLLEVDEYNRRQSPRLNIRYIEIVE